MSEHFYTLIEKLQRRNRELEIEKINMRMSLSVYFALALAGWICFFLALWFGGAA